MGDEGSFNPCECIWGHEMAMRRLLSLLRQSQSVCTDTECFNSVMPSQNQTVDTNFMLMSLFFVFALMMYFLRPRTQARELDGPQKPENHDNGFNGPPPNPPTSS